MIVKRQKKGLSMTQLLDVGVFGNLIKEYVLDEKKFLQLEVAFCELSKLDTILTDKEDRLELIRDLLYLAKYLSTFDYINGEIATVEIYGRMTFGFVKHISFDVSELSTEDLKIFLIKLKTKNKYPVTALATFLWRFTFKGWDNDFKQWYKNENLSLHIKEELFSDKRYTEDFRMEN